MNNNEDVNFLIYSIRNILNQVKTEGVSILKKKWSDMFSLKIIKNPYKSNKVLLENDDEKLRKKIIRTFYIHKGIINVLGLYIEKNQIFWLEDEFKFTLTQYMEIKQEPLKFYLAKTCNLIEACVYLVAKGNFEFFINPLNVVVIKNNGLVIRDLTNDEYSLEFEAPEFLYGKERTSDCITWSIGCLLVYVASFASVDVRSERGVVVGESDEDLQISGDLRMRNGKNKSELDIRIEREYVFNLLGKSYKKYVNHYKCAMIKDLLKKIFKLNRNKRITLSQLYMELQKIINMS